MPLRYVAQQEWVDDARMGDLQEEGQEHVELSREPCRFIDIPPFSECVTKEQKELWLQVNSLALRTSEEVSHRILEYLRECEYGGRIGVGDGILSHLKEHGLISPEFKFRFGEQGRQMLEDVELSWRFNEVAEDEGILLFQLPKPLAKYWWKSTHRTRVQVEPLKKAGNQGLNSTVIEWGSIYRDVMPVVWEARDDVIRSSPIDLDRINPNGLHSPDEYYYVWRVRKYDVDQEEWD